MLNMLSNF